MKIAVLDNVRGGSYEQGVRRAEEKYNIEVKYLTPSVTQLKGSIEEVIPAWQRDTIKELLEEGIKGIALPLLHPQPLISIIKEAVSRGVAVISYDIDGPETERYFYVGTNNYLAGKIAGNNMTSLIGFKGEVVIDSISLTSYSCKGRIEGFKEAVGKYQNVKIVDIVSAQEDISKMFTLPSETISTYKNLSGIFATTGLNAGSNAEVVKRQSLQDKIKIVCFDLNSGIAQFMEEGIIDVAIVQRPYDMGYRVVEFLYRIIKFGLDEVLKSLPKSKIIDTGVEVVTKETLASYKKSQEVLGIKI